MSDDAVVRAVRTLQRNGLPVPMSDEAALTFITGWITLESIKMHNAHPLTGEMSGEFIEMLRTTNTKAVLIIYKQVCEALDAQEAGNR